MHSRALRSYAVRGYHVERQVFTRLEAATLIEHFMALNAAGSHPGDSSGVTARSAGSAPDPLREFPRMIQMHHWDERTRALMNDCRLTDVVHSLLGQPPRLIQTMLYFKPPGSRGQSFHQDNLYLRTTPVVAAWVALDPASAANGAMEMVSGSHLLGLLPCRVADTDLSFTDSETELPPYLRRDVITLGPGDAVFFGGLTIHGSPPNRSKTRFRRAFICHYEGELAYPIVAPDLPRA